MEVKVRTRISNSRLPTRVSNQIREFINSHEGKEIEICLKKARSTRSNPQNRYYWGCVVSMIGEELKNLGHELNKEECHEFLKGKFNYTSVSNETGEFIGNIPQSTTKMSKGEFIEYLDKIVRWAAEILNLVIPDPETQTEIEYK